MRHLAVQLECLSNHRLHFDGDWWWESPQLSTVVDAIHDHVSNMAPTYTYLRRRVSEFDDWMLHLSCCSCWLVECRSLKRCGCRQNTELIRLPCWKTNRFWVPLKFSLEPRQVELMLLEHVLASSDVHWCLCAVPVPTSKKETTKNQSFSKISKVFTPDYS